MSDARQRLAQNIMDLRDQTNDEQLRESLLRIRDEFVSLEEEKEEPKAAPRPKVKKTTTKRPTGLSVRLKSAREAKGMSMKQVAEEADISVLSLSKIEKGETQNPREETLNKIKAVLDIDQGGAEDE